MRQFWSFSLSIIFLSTLITAAEYDSTKTDLSDDLKIVCYYSNWAVYRPGLAKFTPQNINPYLCSHIIYAFAGLSSHFELKPFDPYNDIEQGNYKKFVGLKTYNPKLKTLIAVGGWNEGSKRFSQLVASYTNRQRFVRSTVRFLREHGFDGLDLDWEYPGFRDGGSEGDRSGYTQLIRELREAFELERVPLGKGKLILSVAVPAGQEYIDKGFEVSAISKLVDFMSILSYDYHTAYESETHHHAPLYSRPDFAPYDERNKFSVEWTVDYYLQLGAAKEKLVVGIPTYGRSYTLTSHKDHDMESPADGPGEPGPATREKGYLAYYEICQKIKDEDWNVKRPYPKLVGPFAYKNDQWVGYDDEQIIAEKARFIMERGLGGAMVWTLDNDDFRGICSGEQSPLISSLRTALLSNIIQSSSSQRPVARAVSQSRPAPLTPPPVQFDDDDYLPATEAPKTKRRQPPEDPPSRGRSRQRSGSQRQSGDAFRTPAPPPTPDPGPAFECPDEGFFNNPRDCKKYFWCLDSGPANLGIVPHAFTCPSGLYFNSGTDSCDYPENVVCRVKSTSNAYTTAKPARPRLRPTTSTTTTTTEPPLQLQEEDALNALNNYQTPNRESASSNENVAQLLRLLQTLGGVERLQSLLGSQEGAESEKEASTTTTQSFLPARPTFPDYVTPRRNTPTTETSSFVDQVNQATEKPVANEYQPPFSPVPYRPSTLAEDQSQQALPQNQVPRRPQFETPTTLAPFLQYNEPNRQRGAQVPETAQTPGFSFIYNTPGGRGRDQGQESADAVFPTAPSALQPPITDSPFVYQAPPRTFSPTTAVPETTTEPAIITQTDIPANALRVPVRVQAGRVVRIHAGEGAGGGNGKRRTRVRVRPVSHDRVAAAGSTDEIEAPEEGKPAAARPAGGRRVGIRRRPVLDSPKQVVAARKVVKPIPQQEFPFNNNNNNNNNFKPSNQQDFIVGRRPVDRQPTDEANYFFDPTTTFAPPTSRATSRRIRPGYRPPQQYPRDEVEYEFTDSPLITDPPTPPRSIVSLPATPGRRPSGQRRPSPTTPRVIQTTTTPRPRRPTPQPVKRPVDSATDPPFIVDNDGKVDCYKRGVFRHPRECGRFIVCAPYPKNPSGWRAFIHNCPANQIYLEDVGRCMRGDRSKCEPLKK